MERRLLWAERDVMWAEQRARDAEQKLATALIRERDAALSTQAEIDRSHALRLQLMSMYSSASWKFARPVRAFGKLHRAWQRLLGRAPMLDVDPMVAQAAPAIEPAVVLQGREQAILNRLRGRP